MDTFTTLYDRLVAQGADQNDLNNLLTLASSGTLSATASSFAKQALERSENDPHLPGIANCVVAMFEVSQNMLNDPFTNEDSYV